MRAARGCLHGAREIQKCHARASREDIRIMPFTILRDRARVQGRECIPPRCLVIRDVIRDAPDHNGYAITALYEVRGVVASIFEGSGSHWNLVYSHRRRGHGGYVLPYARNRLWFADNRRNGALSRSWTPFFFFKLVAGNSLVGRFFCGIGRKIAVYWERGYVGCNYILECLFR